MHDDVGMHVNIYRCNACSCGTLVDLPQCISRPSNTTPKQVVDDFAVAQSTPLPECITGIEGDEV